MSRSRVGNARQTSVDYRQFGATIIDATQPVDLVVTELIELSRLLSRSGGSAE